MFGYILPNMDGLTPEQHARYRACYCGLCRTIGSRFSQPVRLTLTYDMTFLVLLLGSLYEPEEQTGAGRCCPIPQSSIPCHHRDHRVCRRYECGPGLLQPAGRLER